MARGIGKTPHLFVAYAVLFLAHAAGGQAIPVLPDPMKVNEIETQAALLDLTAPQQEVVLETYDRYLDSYARVRDRDIKAFEDSLTNLAGRFGFMQFDVPQRSELERIVALGVRAMDRINAVDGSYFDEVSGMCSEPQQRMLARVRLNRELDSYRLVALPLTRDLNRGASVHMTQLVEQIDLDDPSPEVEVLLESYEKRYIAGARDVFDGVLEVITIVLDIVDEIGIRDMEQQEMFMLMADQEFQESMKSRVDTITEPLQRVAFALSQLNWRTWNSLVGALPTDAAEELTILYFQKGFSRAIRGFRGLERRFEKALALDELTEAQAKSIAALQEDFRRRFLRVARGHAEHLEKSREFRTMAQFTGEVAGEHDKAIETAEEQRDSIVESTERQLDGLLGPTLLAQLEEKKEKRTKKSSETVVVVSSDGAEVTVQAGEMEELDELLTGGVTIPPPISPGRPADYARLLGVADDDAPILETLYEGYREQYDATRTSADDDGQEVVKEKALSPAKSARAQREANLAAAQSVAVLDTAFFDDIAAVLGVKRDAPGLVMVEQQRFRERTSPRSGQWWGGMSDTVDLVNLFAIEKGPEITADGQDVLLRGLQSYHEQADAAVTMLATASDRMDRLQTMMGLAESGGDERDAGAMMVAMRERWRSAFADIQEAVKQAARVNQSVVDQLLTQLPETDRWAVRRHFIKAAYPGILNDDDDLSVMLAAAAAIPGLSPQQKGEVNRLSERYRSDWWSISEQMIENRRNAAMSEEDRGEGMFTKADAQKALEDARLDFARSELNDRLRMRLRMLLSVDQGKKVPGLGPRPEGRFSMGPRR